MSEAGTKSSWETICARLLPEVEYMRGDIRCDYIDNSEYCLRATVYCDSEEYALKILPRIIEPFGEKYEPGNLSVTTFSYSQEIRWDYIVEKRTATLGDYSEDNIILTIDKIVLLSGEMAIEIWENKS